MNNRQKAKHFKKLYEMTRYSHGPEFPTEAKKIFTDRYTPYKVPYEIALAIDKLLEKNQVEEKSDYRRYVR